MSAADSSVDIDIKPTTKYLIVIEKEGIFRRLCEDKFPEYGYFPFAVFASLNSVFHQDCLKHTGDWLW